MSNIYFIRHAQAGSRDNYDRLSELGEQQATLLGKHFAEQGIAFSKIISGAMQRQQRTAELVSNEIVKAGLATTDVVVDAQWNEFSLLSVYTSYVSRLIEESESFARDYAEMQEMLKRDPHAVRGAAGRCDAQVIISWMQNRYPVEGESWQAFRSRILSCLANIPDGDENQAIAVFTSATPISIMTGHALELTDEKLLRILGVIANSSVTVMRKSGEDLRLFSFNATPHLNDNNRTYR
ncbi:MAG: histidine phosphatase family protein [Acidobacteriota bacterium]